MASNIQFHFCSLSNKDISFQYDGWGKVRYSYKDCFNIKGQDCGEFSIVATQAIVRGFWRENDSAYPLTAFDMDELYKAPDLSQRLKYLIVLRNIHDLNKIIDLHNKNPKHKDLFIRVINIIIWFFTCGFFTLFDATDNYKQIRDSLDQLLKDTRKINFPSHLGASSKFIDIKEAVSAFIVSEKGRALEAYFTVPNLDPPMTIDELYHLKDGHTAWADLYMCGSELDANGHLPVAQEKRYRSMTDRLCSDLNFQ